MGVKRLTCWFMRLFFACTLAWAIPVGDLFSLEAFWKGTVMGIGPCILTKVLCGPFMGDAKWVIGWAMVGRAEFAYFIAIMANSQKLMSDDLFAILVWALIYATVFAPLVFRKVLANYMSKLNNGKLRQQVKELKLSLESKDAELAQLKSANSHAMGPEASVAEAVAGAADIAPCADAVQLSV